MYSTVYTGVPFTGARPVVFGSGWIFCPAVGGRPVRDVFCRAGALPPCRPPIHELETSAQTQSRGNLDSSIHPSAIPPNRYAPILFPQSGLSIRQPRPARVFELSSKVA